MNQGYTLYPRAYAESQTGAAAWTVQTERLVTGGPETTVDIHLRFLRLVDRAACRVIAWDLHPQPTVEVDGCIYESRQEAAEHRICHSGCLLAALAVHPARHRFHRPAWGEIEALPGTACATRAALVRKQKHLDGRIEIAAEELPGGVYRLRVAVTNDTVPGGPTPCSREQALPHSFLSAQTVLTINNGEFVARPEPWYGERSDYA